MKRPDKPSNVAVNARDQRQWGVVKWRTVSNVYLWTFLCRFKKLPPLAVQMLRH